MKNLISTLMINVVMVGLAVADEGHEHAGAEGDQEHASAVGSPMPGLAAERVVNVTLNDQMKIVFEEGFIPIHSGEIIQFVVTNEGKIVHEFSIGSEEERQEHAAMMRAMPGMTHSDGSTLSLEPGTTASLTWHFDGEEAVMFSCNIPGHFEAGMFREAELMHE